jgi:hypothetical protein
MPNSAIYFCYNVSSHNAELSLLLTFLSAYVNFLLLVASSHIFTNYFLEQENKWVRKQRCLDFGLNLFTWGFNLKNGIDLWLKAWRVQQQTPVKSLHCRKSTNSKWLLGKVTSQRFWMGIGATHRELNSFQILCVNMDGAMEMCAVISLRSGVLSFLSGLLHCCLQRPQSILLALRYYVTSWWAC